MNKSIEYIKSLTNVQPEIGIVLGSGLGDFGETIEDKIVIPYKNIPEFPTSTVVGHEGSLIFGKVRGKNIVAMQGRIHFYEGQGIDKVVYPIKVMADLGIKTLIVTNACGGVNKEFKPGDLMLIKDHINFSGQNPLIGPNDEKGPRFPDMTYTYSNKLRELSKDVGEKLGINLQEGVYMYFTGPNYETPAEIVFARTIGADAAGMSTVPEVIVARHRGIEVLGISCITNMAAGILDQPLNHQEVIEVSNIIKEDFKNLVQGIIEVM
ncbi:purine-nucleoside phosphorylase [Peptoniphilus asaccharolyticus DSM 20463]|uniref:Purine nucleoside phosphorylase n=1 Tax=Peptoniphilus asaccharolyticus DSM 20463 TaxID=573058 RepID=A0A1W1UMW5_PEPAS|nr:purine-nucleoside phosphorylase [Peptoniphilus asaccharolyticus]MBL7574945.1 purine-nucleoside phosphorylase [Peptoniphilus asaccharolyticus]SMB82478.1 purine-nucleoside phosphorylase [Peptoniphilus asaccharolyticus DSM 20463]